MGDKLNSRWLPPPSWIIVTKSKPKFAIFADPLPVVHINQILHAGSYPGYLFLVLSFRKIGWKCGSSGGRIFGFPIDLAHHRRAVAQPCVNGDRLSKGRMAKFDPAQIRNSSTDRPKIWNRWLCRRDDPPCKISCKSVHWGLLGKWVKYNEIFLVYIYTFFCWPTYRSESPADFHARWLKRRCLTGTEI